jgi:hypothetical protein
LSTADPPRKTMCGLASLLGVFRVFIFFTATFPMVFKATPPCCQLGGFVRITLKHLHPAGFGRGLEEYSGPAVESEG